MNQRGEGAEATSELFWESLDDELEESLDELDTVDESIDFQPDELENEELDEFESEERWQRKVVESKELATVTHDYARSIKDWLESRESYIEQHLKERQARYAPTRNRSSPHPKWQSSELQDAIGVIRWYQYQIHVKSVRALRGHLDEDYGDDPLQSDWNGSAKVALLGIERSMSAWTMVRNLLPGDKDAIVDMLIRCGWMRRLLLLEFPDARQFIRPGFDDPS